METATIRFDARNILTISLCGAVGYMIFLGVTIAWVRVKQMKGLPS